jgi:hypothetical protein
MSNERHHVEPERLSFDQGVVVGIWVGAVIAIVVSFFSGLF